MTNNIYGEFIVINLLLLQFPILIVEFIIVMISMKSQYDNKCFPCPPPPKLHVHLSDAFLNGCV